jgi:DNA replication protein DnaC
MSEKIDETLRKLASDIKSGKTQTDKTGVHQDKLSHSDLAGDPNCPYCSGLGYLRFDVPIGHPDFGKVQVCSCRQSDISQQVRHRLFALSNLDALEHLTFENFQPRGQVGLRPMQADSLEQAYNQARLFAQSLKGWLLLQGDYGSGKTHLAAAIANFAVSLGAPTLFITVPDLLDTLRFAYDDPEATFEERFEQVRQSPLLVLDDFGTQNATSWAQEKLFQILNYRYINHLPTVVTTNLLLDEIEGRIRSRLEDPDLVTKVQILAPDFRRPTYDAGHPQLSSLGLLHKMTFASFDLRLQEGLPKEQGQDLKKAFDAARKFAENPRGWLIFTGTYGCGKTHLAAAIANFRSDLGYPPIFVVVPDLLDHLRATFKPTSTISMDRRFEDIRTAPLLILDDLGTQSTTPWAREKIYQLFNYRYSAELPTVITTSQFTDEIDERIQSRLKDTRLCVFCTITAPSYRGTLGHSKKRRNR